MRLGLMQGLTVALCSELLSFLDLILISSGYGGGDDSAMRWCAAADVANLIRAPTSAPFTPSPRSTCMWDSRSR